MPELPPMLDGVAPSSTVTSEILHAPFNGYRSLRYFCFFVAVLTSYLAVSAV